MMNDDPQSERAADPITAPRASTTDMLARLKRASLHSQVRRSVWQLGALVRRVEREAPEVHSRLRSVVEALQLLNARLAMEAANELPSGAESDSTAVAGHHDGSLATSETVRSDRSKDRVGEFF